MSVVFYRACVDSINAMLAADGWRMANSRSGFKVWIASLMWSRSQWRGADGDDLDEHMSLRASNDFIEAWQSIVCTVVMPYGLLRWKQVYRFYIKHRSQWRYWILVARTGTLLLHTMMAQLSDKHWFLRFVGGLWRKMSVLLFAPFFESLCLILSKV